MGMNKAKGLVSQETLQFSTKLNEQQKTNKHWLIPIGLKRSRPLMTPWNRPPWCPPSATPRRDVFDRGQKQSHLQHIRVGYIHSVIQIYLILFVPT